MKEFIIIYCIFTWLIGIGVAIKQYNNDMFSTILAVIIAPIMFPIKLGFLLC